MLKTCLVSIFIVLMLVGCSKIVPKLDEVLPDRRTEYKKSKSLPDLEVPPDLTTDAIQDRMAIPKAGETASFSTFQERAAERKRDEELERSESSAIKLLENETVLAAEGVTVQIWPQLRSFFQGLGYTLELDDEELGVIETAWNENQEELVRDKFKVFAEPGQEPGTTLLYVSHRGEELVPQGDKLVWQARSRDAALERQVVERMEATLNGGASETRESPASRTAERASAPSAAPSADGPQHSELISAGGGKVYLALAEQFNDAWGVVGQALSRTGVEVDQEDRNRGLYIVRIPAGPAKKKQGVFSKLKFWGDDAGQLQLSLTGVGDKTEIVALNRDGQWETSDSAVQFLTRLNQELNAGN